MGPRLFSRGKPSLARRPAAEQVASMGPRLFSRGKHLLAEGEAAVLRRFNGAATVQPRKEMHAVRLDLRPVASMGPRLFSRGKPACSPPARALNRATLQWGRDCSAAESSRFRFCASSLTRFNGAATVQPRKAGRIAAAVSGPKSFNGAATVQPRKGPRGRAATRRAARFNGAATVQPRKGKSQFRLGPKSSPLQWGRDCSAAERWSVVADSAGKTMLQWGRDCSAAERRHEHGHGTATSTLQWGRDCSAAERHDARA